MGNIRNRKHGLSNTRLYRIYNNMKSRCYKIYAKEYNHYGGRGINMCDEWLGENGFINFYNWAINNGYTDELTIDRINNNGNYEPSNCRWISMFVQNNNSRHTKLIQCDGEVHSVSEWARIKNISRSTITKRIKLGWDIYKALNSPIK
jgi:hypothetical protein